MDGNTGTAETTCTTSKPFTVIDLVTAVGVGNIKFQALMAAMMQISTNKRGVTTIKFQTDAITCDGYSRGKPERVGIILWCDPEEFDRVAKANKMYRAESI